MTRNTEEFNESLFEAMEQLEDEQTDIFLQAVGFSDNQIGVQVGYNEKSNIPEEGIVQLLAAMAAAIEPNIEESLEELLEEVGESAVSIQEQR